MKTVILLATAAALLIAQDISIARSTPTVPGSLYFSVQFGMVLKIDPDGVFTDGGGRILIDKTGTMKCAPAEFHAIMVKAMSSVGPTTLRPPLDGVK